MNNLAPSGPHWFEAFLQSAQYLLRLQTQQDVWEHLGKFALTHFPAAWLAVAERDAGGHVSLHYRAPAQAFAAEDLLTSEIRSTVADVLDSGFLASRVLHIPAPSMTVFLPLADNELTNRVLLLGHHDAQPLAKDLLNVYLALAGLAGAALERKRAEQEVRRVNAELEERVAERTAQFQAANETLRKEVVERRQIEEALRENREWLRVTLTSIGDAVIAADTRGVVTFLNPVAATLTGWSVEQGEGQPIQQVFHIVNEQTGLPADDIVARVLREGHTVELANHTVLRAQNGRKVPIEDSAAPIRDSAGKVIGVVVVFHDVTEKRLAQETRRRDEQELREMTQRLTYHVDHSPLAVIEWGPDMRLIRWSGAAERIFGWTAEEVLGKHMEDFRWIYEDDQAQVAEVSAGLQTGAGSGRFSANRNYRKDGSVVHCEWYNSSLADSSGKLRSILSLVLDVSERRRAEQALLSSEKLATVGRMAASIAHEINNPLAAVMNSLYLAQTGTDDLAEVRRYLALADDELRRVAHITQQTLGFYRESSAPTRVSVNAVMDSTVDLLGGRIKIKRAVIEKQYAGDLYVEAVPGELRQVLSNLVGNSLDAIPDEGVIKVRVSKSSAVKSHSNQVRITVADNGKGIDAATLPHIFEPLFTTKTHTGTGLGLWVSKQLIDKHHGCIRVRSQSKGLRRGTVVSVVFPAEPGAAARGQAVAG
jgi:PAS domain S-box-containing protein